MKKAYREENMPIASNVVEYMLETAKSRLGADRVVEACDIPKDLMDDFNNITLRKYDTNKVVMAVKVRRNDEEWFFFSDTEVYLFECGFKKYWCRLPYKSIESIERGLVGGWKVEYDKNGEENGTSFEKAFCSVDGEQCARLLLDLRDYVNKF